MKMCLPFLKKEKGGMTWLDSSALMKITALEAIQQKGQVSNEKKLVG